MLIFATSAADGHAAAFFQLPDAAICRFTTLPPFRDYAAAVSRCRRRLLSLAQR